MRSLFINFVTAVLLLSGTTSFGEETFPDQLIRIRWSPIAVTDRIETAKARIAVNPDDIIGHWLWGSTLARDPIPGLVAEPPDSLGIADLQRRVDAEPDSPGLQIALAAVLDAREDGAACREALLRAAEIFRRRDDTESTFNTIYLLNRLRPGPGDAEEAADLELLAHESEVRGDTFSRAVYLAIQARSIYRKDVARALEIRREALPLLRQLPPGYVLIDCLNGIGNGLRRAAEFEEARPYYEEALEIARQLDFPDGEIPSLEGLALIEKNLKNWSRARDLFDQNIALAERIGDSFSLIISLSNRRQLSVMRGNRQESRQYAERAVALTRSKNHDQLLPSSLDAMATEEISIGRFEQGRKLLEEAIASAERQGNKIDRVFPLLHLGNVYEDLGELERAREVTEQGLVIARESGNKRGEAHLTGQMASILYHERKYEDAYAMAADLMKNPGAGDATHRWTSARTAALSLAALDRVDEAVALLDSSQAEMAGVEEYTLERGRVPSLKGLILSEAGRSAEALPSLEEALAMARAIEDPIFLASATGRVGAALLELGRTEEAIPLLTHEFEWNESIRQNLTVGDERAGFLSHAYDDYIELARALHRAGRSEDAFEILEKSRATEMRRVYGKGAPGLPTHVSESLVTHLETTEVELATVQATVLEIGSSDDAEHRADLPRFEARLDSLRAVRDDIVFSMRREAPDFMREMGQSDVIGVDELQEGLRPGEVFLALMVGNRASLAFLATRDQFTCREIETTLEQFHKRTSDLVDSVRVGGEWSGLAAQVADDFLGDFVWSGDRLIVSPDGPLHTFPFDLLLVHTSPGGPRSMLLEKAEVITTPSATIFFADSTKTERDPHRSLQLVAFGDPQLPGTSPAFSSVGTSGSRGRLELRPLPHAREEALHLARTIPGSRAFVGEQATEKRFFEEAQIANILHVASHALIDDRRPAYSGLVLAADSAASGLPSADGFVQAFEVLRERLSLDLVTLSGCETGRGLSVRGEGLQGLSRAFRLAGAKTLLVSLWEVDDAATAKLMEDFYDSWNKGMTIPAALRQAKLEALHSSMTSEGESEPESGSRGIRSRKKGDRGGPTFWAPFVLQATRWGVPRS